MTREEAYLVVRDPVAGQSILRLVQSERFTLGRTPTNHAVLQDERASRVHCEIFHGSSGWIVRDLKSRNGTLVNGESLDSDQTLVTGDVISIGRVEILFCQGDPPTDPSEDHPVDAGTVTGVMPDELAEWHASIVHRRSRSRLLEHMTESVSTTPRVGRAAAELCRLSFSLGRSGDMADSAKLSLECAMHGVEATRGVVLLTKSGFVGPSSVDTLELKASLPHRVKPEELPWAACATVLSSDEAVLADLAGSSRQKKSSESVRGVSFSAPVRSAGKAIGVLHLEVAKSINQASPDDLEFVLAVCDALGVAIENLAVREKLSSKLAQTADENKQLRHRLGQEIQMIGKSPGINAIIAQIGRVAASKATVLVRGESGVGKELVARALHDASPRNAAPFVCLNCAAITETLLESELFGHEKGSFTGATERKIGKFEAADRGTLMLDEIGEMSPSIQAKFLRVLEGHPFERVGGHSRVQTDVRVVAATNRDLEQAVTAGEFRRDLYFRLKVVEIMVPPLRKRPEDIELLTRHFLERFSNETGRKNLGFTPAAIEAIRTYRWPGNIRELRNVIERAVVLSQEDQIDVDELSLSKLATSGDTGKVQENPKPYAPQSLEEMERLHIGATLSATGGNKSKAASILGIERSTLDRKLAKWQTDGKAS